MAALSPFVLVVECPHADDVSGTGGAVAMWVSIRGFMMALFIVTICEYLSTGKESLAKLAQKSIAEGTAAIQDALGEIIEDSDPTDALVPVSKAVGDAALYSKFAIEEPRMWKCKWKHELLTEVADLTALMRLDIMFMHQAACGTKDEASHCFGYLAKVDAWKVLKEDLETSMANARELVLALLAHERDEFKAFPESFDHESLDSLDGYEEALKGINAPAVGLAFPAKDAEIETIEDDMLVQISILLVMINNVNARSAACSRAAVRES
jgi:hypothetical protein